MRGDDHAQHVNRPRCCVACSVIPAPSGLPAALERVRSAVSAASPHRFQALLVAVEAAIIRRWIVEKTPRRGMRAAPSPAEHGDNDSEDADQLFHGPSPFVWALLEILGNAVRTMEFPWPCARAFL